MPDYSDDGRLGLFPYDTRYRPIVPPDTGIFDEPTICLKMNVKWAGHIDGALERLIWPDAWLGDRTTQIRASGEIIKLLTYLIERHPCGDGDCMDCCDEMIAELQAIKALLRDGPPKTPAQTRERINVVEDAYQTYIDDTEAAYNDDITNVHPEMGYGDSNDPIRDQALCFMTRRFVDLFCDWIIQNIEWKQANQQTALNVASFIGNASEVAARFFAETAFGPLFQNIDTMLELEVTALTLWVTSVSVAELAVYQDMEARADCACGWYKQLAGETPTLALFLSSLDDAVLTGNADGIRDKLKAALVPVDVTKDPDPEHIFFIWSDLWAEAYAGAQAGIVPDCLCDEPDNSWCFSEDLTASDGGYSPIGGAPDGVYGTFSPFGTGWHTGILESAAIRELYLTKTFSSAAKLTRVRMYFDYFNESATDGSARVAGIYLQNAGTPIVSQANTLTPSTGTHTGVVYEWSGEVTATSVELLLVPTNEAAPPTPNGGARLYRVEYEGIDFNPFGSSNC